MSEGKTAWVLKAEGDQRNIGEALLEVATGKVDTEIPSPVTGIVTKILVGEDETVQVGADLAIVGGQAGAAPAPQPPARHSAPVTPAPVSFEPHAPVYEATPHPAPVPEPAPAPAIQVPEPESAPSAPVQNHALATAEPKPEPVGSDASAYVTPLVRKLANDNDVDLGTLTGTGIGGRIRKQDVLDATTAARAAAVPAVASTPAPTPTVPNAAVSPKS